MHEIKVPLLNANEDELNLVELRVAVGDEVKAGDVVAIVESTKATSDVESPAAGFVRRLPFEEDDRVPVGALLCLLTDTADEALPELKSAGGGAGGVKATSKARKLAEAHGIDLSTLGVKGIVKERDVQRAVEKLGGGAAAVEYGEPLTTDRPNKMVILGAGGHARVIIDVARLGHDDIGVIGVVDDGKAPPTHVHDVPVVGKSAKLAELKEAGVNYAGLGVGAVTNNALRIKLYDKLKSAGLEVPNLVHPKANIEPSVTMGEGNQIFAGATIGSSAKLGDNTIINSGVVVSHDCVIGSHTHLTPGAILAGNVKVGENTVIGMGVTVYLGVTIGSNVVVSNGVHIMKDVPDGTIVRAGAGFGE